MNKNKLHKYSEFFEKISTFAKIFRAEIDSYWIVSSCTRSIYAIYVRDYLGLRSHGALLFVAGSLKTYLMVTHLKQRMSYSNIHKQRTTMIVPKLYRY